VQLCLTICDKYDKRVCCLSFLDVYRDFGYNGFHLVIGRTSSPVGRPHRWNHDRWRYMGCLWLRNNISRSLRLNNARIPQRKPSAHGSWKPTHNIQRDLLVLQQIRSGILRNIRLFNRRNNNMHRSNFLRNIHQV